MLQLHPVLGFGILLLVGAVAGAIGSAGGVTSLVSYPALLAFGLPPLAANVTNSAALTGSGLTSALGARPDLVGHGRALRRRLVPMVVFSLAGAVLLIATPSALFDRIVPALIAAASAVLLLQPRIARWQQRRGRRPRRVPAAAALIAIAIYNGYFGAGAGILTIALLMFTAEPVLHRANSMKNVLTFAADLLPAVLFALTGRIVWAAFWPIALGTAAGGAVGPIVARRVPPSVLRLFVGISGLALAVYLAVGG